MRKRKDTKKQKLTKDRKGKRDTRQVNWELGLWIWKSKKKMQKKAYFNDLLWKAESGGIYWWSKKNRKRETLKDRDGMWWNLGCWWWTLNGRGEEQPNTKMKTWRVKNNRKDDMDMENKQMRAKNWWVREKLNNKSMQTFTTWPTVN